MSETSLLSNLEYVYVVMGLDDHACDRLIAICADRDEAENISASTMINGTDIFHIWVERHPVF
jgi:hypothetical protein